MKYLSILTALCLIISISCGCGSKDVHSASPEASFGSSVESVEESASISGTIKEEDRFDNASFSMPCNESYGWDPYNCISMENLAVMQLIYEGLFLMNEEYDFEPVLAKDFTVSEDNLTYAITLQNAVFSNGKLLTADDVVYSMQMAQQSEHYGSRFDDIADYYAAGTDTVVIELSSANDRLPCLMDFPIIPFGSDLSSPPGTGPFVRTGNVLTINNSWWQGADTLPFQTVTLYSSSSAEETRDNFEIDVVHFVYNNPSSTTAASYHGNYELWISGGTVMQYIGFNFYTGIFQDSNVRKAVTHAINRNDIAESVYHNLADPAVLPVSPSSSMYDDELAEQYAYTSAEAAMQELLETDSFYLPEGFLSSESEEDAEVSEENDTKSGEDSASETIEISDELEQNDITYNNITMFVMDGNLNRTAAAEMAAQNLTDAGFTVTIVTFSSDDFEDALQSYEWDIYYGEVTLKPDFDLRSLLTYGGALNYGGFSGSSTLDLLISAAMENSGNRYDLYAYILEYGYLCPVLFVNNAIFTTRGIFTGLNPSPDSLFYQISNIRVDHSG